VVYSKHLYLDIWRYISDSLKFLLNKRIVEDKFIFSMEPTTTTNMIILAGMFGGWPYSHIHLSAIPKSSFVLNLFYTFDVSLFGVSAPGSRLSLRNNIDPSSSVTDLER
jgi:hypothetical protein